MLRSICMPPEYFWVKMSTDTFQALQLHNETPQPAMPTGTKSIYSAPSPHRLPVLPADISTRPLPVCRHTLQTIKEGDPYMYQPKTPYPDKSYTSPIHLLFLFFSIRLCPLDSCLFMGVNFDVPIRKKIQKDNLCPLGSFSLSI